MQCAMYSMKCIVWIVECKVQCAVFPDLYITSYVCTALAGGAAHFTLGLQTFSQPLHYTLLYFTLVTCTTWYCTVLHCTVSHCTTLHCTALHCTVLHSAKLKLNALHFIELHCTALHIHAIQYFALPITEKLKMCMNILNP